jgi:hypothetical protein
VSASVYRCENDTTSRSEGDVKSGSLERTQATSIEEWCQRRLLGESPTATREEVRVSKRQEPEQS